MSNSKKIFRIALSVSVLVLTYTWSFAQQYPVFSQYYFNELVINPAFAGNHVQLSMNATYRNQWVNFPGAPRTFSFTGHTSLVNGRVGVGLLVNEDKIGSYNNQNIYTYYAYRIKMPLGVLSMGLQGGLNLLRADFSKLDLVDPTDPSFIGTNAFKPNFGAGLHYSQSNWFVGFSIPFLMNNGLGKNLEGTLKQISERRYYFLRGGAIFSVDPGQKVKFNPSVLVRAQEGQPLSFDFNAGFVFYDAMSVGASIRSGDAFITFVDFKLSEKIHFAYSYDWTASGLRKYSNGTHEFLINYRAKVTKAQKGLPCPTYYHYGTLEAIKIKKSQQFNRSKK
jgi:type IX secretion system PorP/SprF family membrane protein